MREGVSKRDFLKVAGLGVVGVAVEACAVKNPLFKIVMSELEKERVPRPLLRLESASAIHGYDELSNPINYQGEFESNAGEGEYFLSESDSPLKETELRTGDVNSHEILYRLGFNTESSSEQEKASVFKDFLGKTDFAFWVDEQFKELIYKIIKELLDDKLYLDLISKHLGRGGTFLFTPDSGGHYDRKTIQIGKGANDSEEKIKGVIIHELLHGVTEQLGLYQGVNAGANDHRIIEPVESRIYFTETLLSGKSPFRQSEVVYLGTETANFDPSQPAPTAEFQRCIDDNDLDGLIKYIEHGNFGENKTRHEVGNVLLNREFARNMRYHSLQSGDLTVRITEDKFVPVNLKIQKSPDGNFIDIDLGDVNSDDAKQLTFLENCEQKLDPEARALFEKCLAQMKSDQSLGASYVFTDADIRDIAHLIAIKNAVIAESTRLAALVAKKKRVKIDSASADTSFQKVYRNFLTVFSETMAETKTPPPFFLARKAMDACIAEG